MRGNIIINRIYLVECVLSWNRTSLRYRDVRSNCIIERVRSNLGINVHVLLVFSVHCYKCIYSIIVILKALRELCLMSYHTRLWDYAVILNNVIKAKELSFCKFRIYRMAENIQHGSVHLLECNLTEICLKVFSSNDLRQF